MKKILLSVLMGLMGLSGLQAQTLVDNYRFTTSVDPTAWIDITGVDSALVRTPTGNNISTSGGTASQLTNIGFTFPFAGTDYTTFGINILGAVRLGARIYGTWDGITLSIASTQPKVDGLGVRGMLDSSCYIRCATVGTVGSRVLVVEARMRIYQHQDISVCWQTQLFEATGEVRLVYGPSTGTADMPATQPGLAKNNGDLLFLNHATHSVVPYTSTPVPTNAAGVWPEQWRCYCFVPDSAACPYAPAVTLLGGTADSTVVGWSGNAAAWRLRIPELGLDTVTADTTLLLRNLNPLATYSGTLQRICGVGDSSLHQRPVSISAPCGTVRVLPWTDDFQLAAGDDCWLKPYTASARRWRRSSASNNYYMSIPSGAVNIQYNEWLVSPPIVLPDTAGLTLGWSYRSSYLSVSPQMRVRVLMCDDSDDVDTSAAWQTLRTLNHQQNDFQQYYHTLDAWAGHRVRVAFQRVGRGGGYCDVDNVSIEVVTQPSVVLQTPSTAYAGDTTAIVAVLTGGVLANPQYVWHSTMEYHGQALPVTDGDTLRLLYLAGGLDTITLTLTTDYGTATATAVIDVVDCRAVTTYPWREGFEHGFDCWSRPNSGSNVWNLRSSGAHGGQRVACATMHDSYNIYDTLVSQPIVVPTDAHGLTLSWWMRHDAGTSPSNYRRIWVKALDAANPVWASGDSLFYRNSTDIPTTWQQFSVDLEPLAGQTIRLAFVGSSYYSGKYIYIDDIEIRYTREPVISLAVSASHVYDGDTVTATATLTEGDTAGIIWWMNSRMADMGQADITGSGPQVQIAYHGTGIDTIVASATNAYGTFADTAYVRVCPVQDTLPWVANFVNELPCWQVISGACNVDNNYGYLSFTDRPTAVATLLVYVPDDGNVVLEYSCAYRYFYGSTIVMVTTDMVHFDTIGNEPFTDGTHPSTRIPLSAYAGQYVRVVFKATGEFLQYYLTSVQIRYANEPVVQAEADDGYFPGTPVTLTASLLEGDTVNLTYSWASAMTQRGDATLTFDGGPQATLVPSVGGPDTVTVWATNNHGTDSTTIVVNIKPCATVDSLPWVEDFSNQFTCWWQPAGSQWSPDNTGTMACVINSPTTGDNWLISRAIDLPTLPSAEGEGMQLWWDAAAIYANSHTYSVWITTGDYRDTGSYVSLATYSSTLPTYNSGWNTPRMDLSAYAGQTVHLAFRYQTHYYDVSGIPGILAIDNVRILDTRTPQVAIVPPARCFVDDTVVYRANLIHGVQSGMSYTWQSTMEQHGLADVNFNDSLIYVVYHAAGSDTVSLVASNAYGSDTAWTAMTVKNCPAVTVPWYEDFEVVNPCWSGSWTPDYITYTWLDSTTHVMHSTPNSWYASPWIDLPDTTGLQLMWNKNGSTNSFMKIFVSPTGSIEPADFTDTLLYRETTNGFDSLPLDAYAGRRIRVAFAQLASSNNSDSYVLDDVRVDYNRTPPQVAIHTPSTVYTHDSLPFYATLTAGVAQGLTCTWHSTLGTVFGSGDNIRIYYSSTGTDTLSVIATTAYGTDTATVMFPVVAHEMPQITLSAPSVVLMPVSATFTVIRNNCSSDGLNIVWHSSLMDTTVSTTDYQFTINYTAGGIDTVTVILSNLYGADTAVAIVTVHDCTGQSITPFYEDFEGVAPTAYTAAGNLPSCWDFYWNGSNAAYAPHVITTSGYPFISNIPNHALFMVAGDATGYGNRAEAVLPHFSAPLQTLSIAFDYRTEGSSSGTLTVGYYDTAGVYTIVKTMPHHTGSYLRDTISFESVSVSDAQIVLRWTHNSAYYAAVVDNIVVFHDSDIPAPDSLTVDNIEASQARVSWNAVSNATAYNVLIAGVVNTTVNGSSCTVTGLTPSTTYTVRVAAIVGSETGHYASAVFTTQCGDQPLPYSENFESVALWDGIVPGQLPDCWTKQWAGDAVQGPCVTNASATYSWVTGKSLRFYAGNLTSLDTIAYVILPSFVHNIDVLKLALDYTYAYDYSQGTLTVGYMANSTFTPVYNLPRDTVDTEMQHDTVSFSGVSVSNAKIAIRYLNPGMTNDAYIDNIDVFVDSTLLPPDTIWRSVIVLCDSTMGTVSGGGTYPDSSLVTISATANDGYHFTQWDDGDTNAVRSILLTSDTSFTAYFEANPPDTVWYNVNVVRELNGMIDTVPDGYITGDGSYPEGDTVTLTMLCPDYKCWPTFYGWVLAPGDTVYSDVCQFVITCDTVITAYYVDVVGIEEVENGKWNVEIYPNPSHGDVTIEVTNALTNCRPGRRHTTHINEFTVSVVDLMGRTVIPPTEIRSSFIIHHSTLPTGTFFVRVTSATGTAVRKLIVE